MSSGGVRAFLIVCLAFVGGGFAALANAAPPEDACSLLTQAQVGAALGVPVNPGAYVTPTFKKTCTWNATTGGGGIVTLHLESLDEFEGGKTMAAMVKSASATPVGGVGDEAYYFGAGTLTALVVKKGPVAFKVALYAKNAALETQRSVEKTLALQVVSHL